MPREQASRPYVPVGVSKKRHWEIEPSALSISLRSSTARTRNIIIPHRPSSIRLPVLSSNYPTTRAESSLRMSTLRTGPEQNRHLWSSCHKAMHCPGPLTKEQPRSISHMITREPPGLYFHRRDCWLDSIQSVHLSIRRVT